MFYIYLKAYRQREEYKAEVWRFQTNTTAWIQGIYIGRAIGACLSRGNNYPEKPLPFFGGGNNEEEIEEHISSADDAIRAQTERIDSLLTKQAQPAKEIIGERRD